MVKRSRVTAASRRPSWNSTVTAPGSWIPNLGRLRPFNPRPRGKTVGARSSLFPALPAAACSCRIRGLAACLRGSLGFARSAAGRPKPSSLVSRFFFHSRFFYLTPSCLAFQPYIFFCAFFLCPAPLSRRRASLGVRRTWKIKCGK